ncbi:MAG: aldo/keto reductase [Candidatus Algichlamydia australiensis]|nr:aldo/keto reductase [Chlamydiales bacterium]
MNLDTSRVQTELKKGICKINHLELPAIGFGTYPLQGEVCTKSVQYAIEAGYRIIDTATYYENFPAIAEALQGKDRKKFYIISKVWHDKQHPKDLHDDINKTLRLLKTDYLDAYLLHWPNSTIPIDATLKAMNNLLQEGKIRHIGLSNVSVNHVKKALTYNIPVTWVQVEMHPNFCDFDLLKFCSKHSITTQAWRPLDQGRISQDPFLKELGNKYQKTTFQVALRWITQHKCIPLPGSQNRSHIEENRSIFDFLLSEKEMDEIDEKARQGKRFRLSEKHGLGFTDEFDFSYEQCWSKEKFL